MTKLFSSGYGLLIGICGDLPVTVADVTGLRDVLVDERRAAYLPQNVETLVETEAHREALLGAFDRLRDKVATDPAATAFVYC